MMQTFRQSYDVNQIDEEFMQKYEIGEKAVIFVPVQTNFIEK